LQLNRGAINKDSKSNDLKKKELNNTRDNFLLKREVFGKVLALGLVLTVLFSLIGADAFASNIDPVFEVGLEQRAQETLDRVKADIDQIRDEALNYQMSHIQTRGVTYGGFAYLDGDILVTKSTSSSGIVGHAGIIVGTKVLEITPAYNGGTPARLV